MEKESTYQRLRKRIQTYADRYPAPTSAENIESFKLLRKLEAQGSDKAKELRRRLIISNGAFGMRYAIKYSRLVNDNEIIEDLFQQAQIGIIEVTDKFDPYKGINFTTYAWHYVRKCIVDYIKKNKIVIAPRDIAKNIKIVTKALDKLYTDRKGCLVRADDIQREIKESHGIKLNKLIIEDTLILIDLNSAGSPDTFVVGSVGEIASEENNGESQMLLNSLLLKELEHIEPDLLDIIKMRFGIEYNRPYQLSEIKMIKGLTDKQIEEYKEKTRAYLNIK